MRGIREHVDARDSVIDCGTLCRFGTHRRRIAPRTNRLKSAQLPERPSLAELALHAASQLLLGFLRFGFAPFCGLFEFLRRVNWKFPVQTFHLPRLGRSASSSRLL